MKKSKELRQTHDMWNRCGKTKCCARFCDFRGLGVYHKVWFDRTENLDKIGCHVTVAMYKENKTY